MLKPVITEASGKTPEVIFDKENNVFQIKGRSISENAHEFYKPLREWLEEYFKNPNKETKLVLNFDYLNSSSLIQISKIIHILEKHYKKGHNILLVWQYEDDDELIENTGIELNLVSEVPFVTEVFASNDYETFSFDFDEED